MENRKGRRRRFCNDLGPADINFRLEGEPTSLGGVRETGEKSSEGGKRTSVITWGI